ncbi:retrovirus-related Pol polyprotein from transposon 17.6 [Trichonephila clavipes]|nr:retrovirus-related Pol polyprotein from transposon 17.6 [Trichonephila clavipes]
MEEIVEKVSAAPYVTVMDLSKGYFQIPLTPRAQRYAAFVTPFGTYIPKKMMFGLVCAPYYFCKLMAQILEGLEQFALPYIDDIAIFSQGWKDHVKAYRHSFRKIEKGGAKSETLLKFGRGSLISRASNWFRDTIASPLTDALKGKIKKEKITWDEKCGKAFEELKAKLFSQPILFAPDFATDFILQTDATERNYSTVERELAAIIFGLKRLKHYLDGQKFIIETDHNPLTYLNKMGSTNPRSLPGQLTVALHTQWRIVLKGGKTTTVGRRGSAVGACVKHLLVCEERVSGRLADYGPMGSNELRFKDRLIWAHQ